MYSASSSPFSRNPGAVKLKRYHTGPLLPGRLTDQSSGRSTVGASWSLGKPGLSDTTAWAEWMFTVWAMASVAASHSSPRHSNRFRPWRQPLRDVPRADGRVAG